MVASEAVSDHTGEAAPDEEAPEEEALTASIDRPVLDGLYPASAPPLSSARGSHRSSSSGGSSVWGGCDRAPAEAQLGAASFESRLAMMYGLRARSTVASFASSSAIAAMAHNATVSRACKATCGGRAAVQYNMLASEHHALAD